MPLTPIAEFVGAARAERRGVGAFNVIQLEHAEALVAGAEEAGLPVVLQISENAVGYHGSLAPVLSACLALGRASTADVAVHLDHAESVELVREAVHLGVGSVMFDASKLDYDANVELTRDMVRFCHDHGVWVEAELGEVGGKDGVHAPGVRTDPAEAAAYVAATGVDALAVAVGTSHAMLDRVAVLDLDLIAALREAVPVPLVLHGSSGVSDADLVKAVEAGMTKINIATHLNAVMTAALRAHLLEHPANVDPRRYLGAGRAAVQSEAERLLRLLDASRSAC